MVSSQFILSFAPKIFKLGSDKRKLFSSIGESSPLKVWIIQESSFLSLDLPAQDFALDLPLDFPHGMPLDLALDFAPIDFSLPYD